MFDESICCCPICGYPLPIFGECPVCKREKEVMINKMLREWKSKENGYSD